MGIPLLRAMYGDFSGSLMVQIVVLQSVIWYTLMLFLFEYRGAKALISEQFPPDIAGSITSFKVESDVMSLNGREPLQADAEIVATGRSTLSCGVVEGTNSASIELQPDDFYTMLSSKLASPMTGAAAPGLGLEDEVNRSWVTDRRRKEEELGGPNSNSNKELHMFVWSSSASPVSEANLRNAVNRAASTDFGATDPSITPKGMSGNTSPITKAGPINELEIEDGGSGGGAGGEWQRAPNASGERDDEAHPHHGVEEAHPEPNTYSSLLGLAWSSYNIEMPSIIKGSISILSDAGLGMAMFSLAYFDLFHRLFMALQPKIIACGKSVAAFSMAVRFLTGPAVIAATAITIGVRGVFLHIAIVQAALPQGIVPFVFAKEYNCHPDILSTAVIFGMLIALPITILYYVLLGV
uniref:Auxin efflux carrier component n=1 Tax=Ananas comosus var. bracteatus TaxID=296719 RepID=A0A6V7QAP9_ANACO|nr:unnamed protein product [Ananas comosus var. bracteatus]